MYQVGKSLFIKVEKYICDNVKPYSDLSLYKAYK